FQAEDGIRDATVTGVQTCALPISNEYCTPKVIPPATDMLTPVLMLYPGDVPVWTARPEAVIKSVTCRPLSGRSSMRWVSKTRARSEERRVGKECRLGR